MVTINEITKRNIGLFLSEGAGCTHHMAMDSDEFYTESQFEYLKQKMTEEDLDSSACQMITYYKEPIYRLEPKEDYYVSLIFKIKKRQTICDGMSLSSFSRPNTKNGTR